jgi:hypothetical protein
MDEDDAAKAVPSPVDRILEAIKLGEPADEAFARVPRTISGLPGMAARGLAAAS